MCVAGQKPKSVDAAMALLIAKGMLYIREPLIGSTRSKR